MDDFGQQLINFAGLIILALVPYVLASQGTMIGGKTGLFNVAQEGIMLVGASIGFLATLRSGSLLIGILAAMAIGGMFGLVLAYFTTTLKMNQFVIGLALFLIGLALSTLFYKIDIGVTLQPTLISTLKKVPIPGLSAIPVIGPVFFNQNLLVYFSGLLSLFLYYLLHKTSFGLELRAIGENPKAADSLGLNVTAMRYSTAIVGGMLMALAGAYLPMAYTGLFTEGIVNGRGWLSIALTFFGGWQPHLIFFGALFFASVDAISLRVQVLDNSGIPYQFLEMLPYIATILVMMPSFKASRPPAFLGQNYDREKRTLS